MNRFNWNSVRESKDDRRAHDAMLPFEEKLRILERLHARDQELRATRAFIYGGDVSNTATGITVLTTHQQYPTGSLNVTMLGASPVFLIAANALRPDPHTGVKTTRGTRR